MFLQVYLSFHFIFNFVAFLHTLSSPPLLLSSCYASLSAFVVLKLHPVPPILILLLIYFFLLQQSPAQRYQPLISVLRSLSYSCVKG